MQQRYENNKELNLNFLFFTNDYGINNVENIDEFVKTYRNNFGFLEYQHDYIQWLFPIYTQGLNYKAHPLQLHELEVNFSKIFLS